MPLSLSLSIATVRRASHPIFPLQQLSLARSPNTNRLSNPACLAHPTTTRSAAIQIPASVQQGQSHPAHFTFLPIFDRIERKVSTPAWRFFPVSPYAHYAIATRITSTFIGEAELN